MSTLIAEALDHLAQQFRGQPNLEALLEAYLSRLVDVETALQDLEDKRSLDTATGTQLDGLGDLVGVQRGALDDVTYLARLRAQIRLNISEGTGEDVIAILVLALAPTAASVEVSEWPPAEAEVILDTPQLIHTELEELVAAARPAAVRVLFRWHEAVGPDSPFVFAGGAGLGFDDGLLAGVTET